MMALSLLFLTTVRIKSLHVAVLIISELYKILVVLCVTARLRCLVFRNISKLANQG